QPKVRLSDRRTVGFEALVRWQHPLRGLLPPVEFLPLAEQSGSFVQLSYHFFAIAMGWFASVCGRFPVSMAVNLSAQCLTPRILPIISATSASAITSIPNG